MSLWRSIILVGCALTTSCSLVFELEDEQCATDGDCHSRGGAFASSVCVAGYCRAPEQASGCASNAECTGPQLCMNQVCTKITNLVCPEVLGEENLRAEAPIVFAIFAPIDQIDADGTRDIQSYILALDEFERELPGGPGGTHPFAALVCDSRKTDTALKHAVETVKVPAVIAGLSSDDIVTGFESVGREHGVFFLSPYEADSALTAIKDDSLIWHMLGSTTDLAPVYGPLMQRIEAHLALSEPIRVALVENDEIFELDLADAISANMKISGTIANQYASFSRHGISPSDSAKTNAVMQKLLTEIKPHVIISAAGDEFVSGVLNPLEIAWDSVAKTQRPFYVVSIENRVSKALFEQFKARPTLQSRTLGVNYASAMDTSLRDAYIKRFESKFPSVTGFEGFENNYDTMYYLLYAFVGAGNVAAYTGADVARGMTRLLSGLRIDVDPAKISTGTAALQNPTSKIELYGTMGPPNFDPGSGARQSEGSVWCVDTNAEAVDDALRLDETKQALVGDFSCFAF